MKINKNSLIYMMSLFPILVSQVVYTIINSKFAIFLLVLKMFVFIYYFGKTNTIPSEIISYIVILGFCQ